MEGMEFLDDGSDVSEEASDRDPLELFGPSDPDAGDDEVEIEAEQTMPSHSAVDITLTDEVNKLLLRCAAHEVAYVVRKFRQHHESSSIHEDSIEYFLGQTAPIHIKLRDRINEGLLAKGFQLASHAEMYMFFEAMITCHIYSQTPQNLYSASADNLFVKPRMELERFLAICGSLHCRVADEPPAVPDVPGASWVDGFAVEPKYTDALREFSYQSTSLAYCPTASIITIDDDKVSHRSPSLSAMGLARGFHRDGSPGPTLHIASSASTGMMLAIVPRLIGDTSTVCLQQLLMSVTHSREWREVNLNGAILALDREYWSTSVAAMLREKNCSVLGTLRRGQGGTFTFSTNFTGPQQPSASSDRLPIQNVCIKGVQAAFWETLEIKGHDVPTHLLQLAYRSGTGRVALLGTTLTTGLYDHKHWMFVTAPRGAHDELFFNVGEQAAVEPPALWGTVEKTTKRLSLTQRGAEWFLLRTFRFTSSVASLLLAVVHNLWFAFKRETGLSAVLRLSYCNVFQALGMELIQQGTLIQPPDIVRSDADLDKLRVDQLKNLCASHGMKGYSNKKKPELISAIKEYFSNPQLAATSIYSVLFKTWFMKPFHGTRSTAAGIINEVNVVKHFHRFVAGYDSSEGSRIACVGTTGLAVRMGHGWIGASVDAVIGTGVPGDLAIALLEVKTVTTAAGKAKVEMLSAQHDAFASCNMSFSSEDAKRVKLLIPSLQDRTQILHHATTFDADVVYYAQASTTEMIRVVKVTVDSNLRAEYMRMLDNLKDNYLGWVYSGQSVPNFSVQVLGECMEIDTLLQRLALWQRADNIAASNPFPRCKRLLPTLVHLWNRVKGPVDTVSRQLSNIGNPFISSIRGEGVVWERLICTALINAHAIVKAHLVNDKWTADRNAFQGIESLRNYGQKHAGSFIQFIMMARKHFSLKVNTLLGDVAQHAAHTAASLPAAAVQQQPPPPFVLPRSHAQRGHVVEVFNSLGGRLFRFERQHFHDEHPHGNRRLCFLCDKTCAYFCKKCQRTLCMKKHEGQEYSCSEVWHNFDNVLEGQEEEEEPVPVAAGGGAIPEANAPASSSGDEPANKRARK